MNKETIKQLRLELGLNQKDMAKVLGFGSFSRISEIENGGKLSIAAKTHLVFLKYMLERHPKTVKNFIKYKLGD